MTIFYFTFIWTCVRTSTGSSIMTSTCGAHPPIFVAAELYTKQIFFVLWFIIAVGEHSWWGLLSPLPWSETLYSKYTNVLVWTFDWGAWISLLSFSLCSYFQCGCSQHRGHELVSITEFSWDSSWIIPYPPLQPRFFSFLPFEWLSLFTLLVPSLSFSGKFLPSLKSRV